MQYFLFSYSTMSKPVVFDDILKKSKGWQQMSFAYVVDILNDDYLFGTKMAMKIKHIQGVVNDSVVFFILLEHYS